MIKEELVRRERREQIIKDGRNPYTPNGAHTHDADTVLSTYDELEKTKAIVSVAGRIRALRKHGGLTFVRVEDATGIIQVALHRDIVGIPAYDQFHNETDVGDFYRFEGTVFKTMKGEKTIDTRTYTLLTKSLLPLPEKFHGLTDTEKRYRQRYLDLIVNPSSMALAKTRAKIVRIIRTELEEQGFLEVETPILQPIAGGAAANPFITHHNTLHHDFYLRIAPELYLKRLVVGGFEKVYEFARCFRNEGISPQHNPEFTQIECYWAYATIEDLINHIEALIKRVVFALSPTGILEHGDLTLDFSGPIKRTTFREAILEKTGIDIDAYTTEDSLRNKMIEEGVKDAKETIGLGALFDVLYKEKVRPFIVQPTFVTEYPASMKPLAKRSEERPNYSASAQLVIKGVEVWNAFNELNDPIEQEERFNEQDALRERGSDEAQAIDNDFLAALKTGLPPTAGYGLGIDRFVMLLTGAPNLKEVILFPTLKPLPSGEGEASDEPQE